MLFDVQAAFTIEATHRIADGSTGFAVRFDAEADADAGWSDNPVGLARKLENATRAPERRLDFYRGERVRLEKAVAASRKSLADVKDFAQADEMAQMDGRIAEIEAEHLADAEKDQEPAKESRFGDDRPVVATLTGDELGEWSDIRQLARKAQAWYRTNLVGADPVTNKNTGWVIGFDSTGSRKIGGRKGDILFRLVPAIPAILENGRLISSEFDNRGRDESRAVHKFAARVLMARRAYPVVATVRETVDGKFHYDLSMDRGANVGTQEADRVTKARSGMRADNRESSGFSTATVREQGPRTSALEGGSADLKLDILDAEINGDPAVKPARAREIIAAARAELEKVGIAGRGRRYGLPRVLAKVAGNVRQLADGCDGRKLALQHPRCGSGASSVR